MKTFIKWIAVILLAPIFIFLEIREILREADITMPEADGILNDMKKEMKKTKKKTKKNKRR